MVYYYVPVEYVINRLNQASDNVQVIIKDKIIIEKETIVLVSLTIERITKEAFGSSVINGNIGDSLKSAASDGIRKAANYFGMPCIFHTKSNNDQQENKDNSKEDEQYRCSICNQLIPKQVYNYSINNFNKVLCIRHQKEYRQVAN